METRLLIQPLDENLSGMTLWCFIIVSTTNSGFIKYYTLISESSSSRLFIGLEIVPFPLIERFIFLVWWIKRAD